MDNIRGILDGWFVIIKFDCVSASTFFFATVYMRLVYAALKDEEFSAFFGRAKSPWW